MAITILSIPAESAEAERIFSGARRTCRWDRLSLKCDNIEAIECVGSWLRNRLISPASEDSIRGIVAPVVSPDENEVLQNEAIQRFVEEGFDEDF